MWFLVWPPILFVGEVVVVTLGFLANSFLSTEFQLIRLPQIGQHGLLVLGCWLLAIIILGLTGLVEKVAATIVNFVTGHQPLQEEDSKL